MSVDYQKLGVLSLTSIESRYESMTGISRANSSSVNDAFSSIPITNWPSDINNINALFFYSVFKISTSYCSDLSDNSSLLTEKLGSSLEDLLNWPSANLAQLLLERLQFTGEAVRHPSLQEVQTFAGIIDQLKVDLDSEAQPKSALFIGLCSMVLGNIENLISYNTEEDAMIVDNEGLTYSVFKDQEAEYCGACHGANSNRAYKIHDYDYIRMNAKVIIDRINLGVGEIGLMPPAGNLHSIVVVEWTEFLSQFDQY